VVREASCETRERNQAKCNAALLNIKRLIKTNAQNDAECKITTQRAQPSFNHPRTMKVDECAFVTFMSKASSRWRYHSFMPPSEAPSNTATCKCLRSSGVFSVVFLFCSSCVQYPKTEGVRQQRLIGRANFDSFGGREIGGRRRASHLCCAGSTVASSVKISRSPSMAPQAALGSHPHG
jgi:hypothetical protein